MLDLTDVIRIDPNIADDIRIRDIRPLDSPATIIAEFPRSGRASDIVTGARDALHRILQRHDDRLAVIIGPCSIHDPDAALEYPKPSRNAVRADKRDGFNIFSRMMYAIDGASHRAVNA